MARHAFDPLVAEWESFAGSDNFNLVEKCLKLAQILEYPELDIEKYVQKITRIGLSLRESVGGSKNPTYLLSMLNEHLYENLGFAGDAEDYYDPRNNFLNDVVDKKSGLPITMSVLYVEVAKSVGLDLNLVGFPGHVLVRYGRDVVLDPFHDGNMLGPKDLQEMLDASFAGRVMLEPRFLDAMGWPHVLARLARNLKNSYTHSYAYEEALRCVDMALVLEPNSPEDIRDKGVLEERMLNHDIALDYLSRYLEMNPNGDDADHILDVIRGIRMKNLTE